MLGRIPFVKSIYSSVKQVSATRCCRTRATRSARRCWSQFPHEDSWTIAFLTGTPAPRSRATWPRSTCRVYVPTTPNPTSGYFLMVPRSRVRELDMTVDEALKYIISMGVVMPRGSARPAAAAPRRPPRPRRRPRPASPSDPTRN